MVNMVPPFFINGSARWAIRMNDQHETSIVLRKPSRPTSTTRPWSASFGDQALFALQRDLGIREYRNHDTLSCLALDDGLFNSSDNVCCAIINSSSVGMT